METGGVFEQHPVPQNISSYQFRLVGDMTIKQFFQLAAGAVIALIIYATPLPGFLKWPFIIVVVLFGAAFAFLPIQERPLEEWVAAFFRSIYAPTIYKWGKLGTPPKYFQPEIPQQIIAKDSATATPHKETQTEAMTKSLQTSGAQFLGTFEETEKKMLEKFTKIIKEAAVSVKATQARPPSPAVPQEPSKVITNLSPVATPSMLTIEEVNPSPKPMPLAGKAKQDVIVPIAGNVQVARQGYQPFAPEASVTAQASAQAVPQILSQEQAQTIGNKPQFSPDAAPPIPPSQPNVVVGQVTDDNSKIIEGAILEIKDPLGRPVRALKTNKAGHFQIVTPLNNGTYEITTEKEGFIFNAIELEVKGSIIPPILIKAKPQKNAKN